MSKSIFERMLLVILVTCLRGYGLNETWFPSTERGEYNRCKAYPLPMDSIWIAGDAAYIWLNSKVDTNKLARKAGDTLVFSPRQDFDTILVKAGKRKATAYLKAKSGSILEVKQLRRRVKMVAIPCD